jgi:hypothetical protein
LLQPEMRYCEINKEMSSLYFGLAVFLGQNLTHFPTAVDCTVYSVHCTLYTASNYATIASNWQNTSSPIYNDDISLLI